MSDLISRQGAIDALLGITAMRNTIPLDSAIFNIKKLPSAQPEQDIGNDGTLYISVPKGQLDKIGRVLVEENEGIFCKQFY